MNRTGKVLGSILIIFGILFLLKNFTIFDPLWHVFNFGFIISRFWPTLFVILPGVLFHTSFISGNKRKPGLLVPGGILLVMGLAFQINMLFGGWQIMWPVYIFSVAFGLFELYMFGSRERGLLIPIGILTGLSVLFFLSFSLNRLLHFNASPFVIPMVLIGIGAFILSGAKNSRS